jgi:acetyl-CoA synthetase
MTLHAMPMAVSLGYKPIVKRRSAGAARPNLADYEDVRASFTWEQARDLLSGLPGNRGLNIAYEAVDRHVDNGLAAKTAIRWISKDDAVSDLTYGDLMRLTSRFANTLDALGVGRGDRVYALTGRIPELYVAALGALKSPEI